MSLKLGREEGGRGSFSKDWSSYSAPHTSVKCKRLVTDMKTALSGCGEHFVPLSVDVKNVESKRRLTYKKVHLLPTVNKITRESLERFTL